MLPTAAFKHSSQSEEGICLSVLPEGKKGFTHITFFHQYRAENTGLAFSPLTRHKAVALPKGTRKRNKNDFGTACLKHRFCVRVAWGFCLWFAVFFSEGNFNIGRKPSVK